MATTIGADGNITKDAMYGAVAPDDFESMLTLDRYGERSTAFDKIISATHDHFWDPLDKRYIDFDEPFDLVNEALVPDEQQPLLRLPYVAGTTKVAPASQLGSIGSAVPPYDIVDSPPVNYPALNLGGVAGEMRAPIIGDPVAGVIDGEPRLTVAEVNSILTLAARRAAITRAGIRLPTGQSARVFIAVINNPHQPNVTSMVLGTFRVGEATMFSWDVAVQKARTALFFSTDRFAASRESIERIVPAPTNSCGRCRLNVRITSAAIDVYA